MMPEMTRINLHRELSRVAPDQADRMIFVTGGAYIRREVGACPVLVWARDLLR